jgi:glycerol-3-phosphate dehydrogenase
VPWHNKIVLGTTDTPVKTKDPVYLLEPTPLKEEIDFILNHIGRYLAKDPQRSDVKSMFAGLRPLVKGSSKKTAALSRDHIINVSDSGLITVTGGKWTTYRKMAEDAVNIAIEKNGLPDKQCVTGELKLFGHDQPVMPPEIFHLTKDELKTIIKKSVEQQMCMTVEDFLSRRTRCLLLDAKKSIELAPFVAGIMAEEMNKNNAWIENQISSFKSIAKNYLPG